MEPTLVKHTLIALLLLACEEPTPSPAPQPPEVAEAPEPEEPPLSHVAQDGRPFPFETFGGRWRCTAGWIRLGIGDDYAEGEREGVIIEIGRNVHAPSHLTATVEGCPFFISTIPPPNPVAWNLGPNRCGSTRYTDGFLLLEASHGLRDVYDPTFVIAQTNGVDGMHHISNTYHCYNQLRPQ